MTIEQIAWVFNRTIEEVEADAEELRVLGNEHRNTEFDDDYRDALRTLTR